MAAENEKWLRLTEVENIIGFKRSFIYDRMKRGLFPEAVHISKNVRWRLSEVQGWMENQI